MSNPPPLPKPSGCVSGLAPPRPSASVPDDREDPPPPSLPSRSARRCAIASFSAFRFLFGDPPGETPIPPPPLAAPFADLALSPCPRFDDTVPPLSNSSVFAGVDGEIGGVDPRAPRFAPAPPTPLAPFFGESGADATERSSSPALASANTAAIAAALAARRGDADDAGADATTRRRRGASALVGRCHRGVIDRAVVARPAEPVAGVVGAAAEHVGDQPDRRLAAQPGMRTQGRDEILERLLVDGHGTSGSGWRDVSDSRHPSTM